MVLVMLLKHLKNSTLGKILLKMRYKLCKNNLLNREFDVFGLNISSKLIVLIKPSICYLLSGITFSKMVV